MKNSPEEQEMLGSSSKLKNGIKKLPEVNLFNTISIMRSDEKSVAISAVLKVGHQRLRQVILWEKSDDETANEFFRQNPGMLDRRGFRTPTNKLEKLVLLDRLRKAEIEGYAIKEY